MHHCPVKKTFNFSQFSQLLWLRNFLLIVQQKSKKVISNCLQLFESLTRVFKPIMCLSNAACQLHNAVNYYDCGWVGLNESGAIFCVFVHLAGIISILWHCMVYFTVGINRLLGNNTYEAAFPPHEVRRFLFVLKCVEIHTLSNCIFPPVI